MTNSASQQAGPAGGTLLGGLGLMALGVIGFFNGVGPFFREVANGLAASAAPGSFLAENWTPGFLVLPAIFLFGGVAFFFGGLKKFRGGMKKSAAWVANEAQQRLQSSDGAVSAVRRGVQDYRAGNRDVGQIARNVHQSLPPQLQRSMQAQRPSQQRPPQPQQLQRPQQPQRLPQQRPVPQQSQQRPVSQQPRQPQGRPGTVQPKSAAQLLQQAQQTLQAPVQRPVSLPAPDPADLVNERVSAIIAADGPTESVLTRSSLTTSALMSSSLTTSSLFPTR